MGIWPRKLRAKLPLTEPYQIRIGPLEDFGDTTYDGERFIIRLDPRWGWPLVRETLCHEWAHCRVWDLPGAEDHGATWGVEYSRAYQCLVGS